MSHVSLISCKINFLLFYVSGVNDLHIFLNFKQCIIIINLVSLKMHLQISHADLTFAGAMKMAAEETLPFWWDDASDFSVLEAYHL